ncbi:MAG: hypothetical protein WAK60_00190 [Sedimentisphaerales bacterium]
MNIVEAKLDQNIFRTFLQDGSGSVASWKNWIIADRVLYGLPIKKQHYDLIRACTGRNPVLLPLQGFSEALFLTGRRSGKSKEASVICAYEAALSGKEKLLSKGETGLVACIAPSKRQAAVERNYIRAIFDTDLLKQEITDETAEGFKLSNGVYVTVLAGDWRLVRNFTVLACVITEAAFFGLDEESKVRSDTELVRAIRPSLATVNGRLTVISSPYAKKGYCYQTHKKYFGNNVGSVLVWNCASRVMNPTLNQDIVDKALAEDLASARAEYLAEFRDDISAYLSREIVEICVIRGRKELLPETDEKYYAFCDVSGGRSDDASLSIAHRDKKRKVIIDIIRRHKAPHSPAQIIASMSEEIKRFGLREITGDAYAAQFVVDAFKSNGIRFIKSELNKSEIYLEMLPRICSNQVELLDDEILILQLAGLERRTRSGGKDIVDHQKGAKDDVANAVSGVSAICGKTRKSVGVW